MTALSFLAHIWKFTFRTLLNIVSVTNRTFTIKPFPATIIYRGPNYQIISHFQNQKGAKFLRKQTYSTLKSKLKLWSKKAERILIYGSKYWLPSKFLTKILFLIKGIWTPRVYFWWLQYPGYSSVVLSSERIFIHILTLATLRSFLSQCYIICYQNNFLLNNNTPKYLLSFKKKKIYIIENPK